MKRPSSSVSDDGRAANAPMRYSPTRTPACAESVASLSYALLCEGCASGVALRTSARPMVRDRTRRVNGRTRLRRSDHVRVQIWCGYVWKAGHLTPLSRIESRGHCDPCSATGRTIYVRLVHTNWRTCGSDPLACPFSCRWDYRAADTAANCAHESRTERAD